MANDNEADSDDSSDGRMSLSSVQSNDSRPYSPRVNVFLIPSYLSSIIWNELIDVMGKKVLNIIIAEIQESQYFSISVDSTPDVTHTSHQLTFTFRYVKGSGTVERFVKFIPIARHTGEFWLIVFLNF